MYFMPSSVLTKCTCKPIFILVLCSWALKLDLKWQFWNMGSTPVIHDSTNETLVHFRIKRINDSVADLFIVYVSSDFIFWNTVRVVRLSDRFESNIAIQKIRKHQDKTDVSKWYFVDMFSEIVHYAHWFRYFSWYILIWSFREIFRSRLHRIILLHVTYISIDLWIGSHNLVQPIFCRLRCYWMSVLTIWRCRLNWVLHIETPAYQRQENFSHNKTGIY